MKNKFLIVFTVLTVILAIVILSSPPFEGQGYSRFHPPAPNDINVGDIIFKVPGGYVENENESVFNENESERVFYQNEFLLLSIKVCEFKNDLDLDNGQWVNKSINGIDGIFKSENITSEVGLVKNTHERYYFNYIKEGKLVMIKCDNLKTIEKIVN